MSTEPETEKGKDKVDGDAIVHVYDPSSAPERPTWSRTGLTGIYYHPLTQVCMVAFVCFMCPGLYNALNGLGAGGQVDATTSSNANSVHYATFAFFAFFAGSVNNIDVIGIRLALMVGSGGYCVTVGSYLAMNIHPGAGPFVITGGALQGIGAGLLWSAQGSIMLAYPTEGEKGKYIGIFWGIFNLGSVVGSCVSLGQNFRSKANSVGNGTYIGFLVLTLIGVTIPLSMAEPTKIIRTDGTRVTIPHHLSWRRQLYGLWFTLKTDPMIVMLFPMFFASNWFYTWQFNDYNAALFNIRTRSLNNLVYWMAQIFGAMSLGLLLDRKTVSRRVRAFSGWALLLGMVFVVHIWGYFYQRDYTRASVTATTVKIDFSDRGYAARIWFYIFCGLLDAMWQTMVYWIIGAMSNDLATLAHFTGFYKALQSAGAAGVWRADGVKLPYMNIFVSTWVLLVSGLTFALPMIHLRIKNHTDTEIDVLTEIEDVSLEKVPRRVPRSV